MILYLIRHGRSQANEQRLVTGTPSDSLSVVGRNQAAGLADWLSKQSVQPERFMVSHWSRARETAEIVFPEADWVTDTRLGETDAGSVANLPLTNFLQDQPNFYANLGNRYPGGESHLDLNARTLACLDEQLQKPCRLMAVVAHSGPITCILQHVLQMDMTSFPAFLPMHATVSVVHFSNQSGVWTGRLAGFALGPAENTVEILHGDH
ncbi:hypothetical protein AT959_12230 [Dechloromonas denitrificans]|uniref:Phosphoglycerate mutase n=1 Tax=Dechloromonas denitrificans TaxID=281362 RepID=A0A133XGQ9_9RHOO|nr:histidine phosphatase family protein [Dechloromonas denitrificans]KXB30135.1 hypothetical protein AT959_12230 [Dechloromonas denitrificans]